LRRFETSSRRVRKSTLISLTGQPHLLGSRGLRGSRSSASAIRSSPRSEAEHLDVSAVPLDPRAPTPLA
jgi:hypothetical protein